MESIINLLEEKSYSKAMPAIEDFINQHHQLAIYTDPELEGLKLETKILEAEVNILSNEKTDLEKLIHEFGVRHNNIKYNGNELKVSYHEDIDYTKYKLFLLSILW